MSPASRAMPTLEQNASRVDQTKPLEHATRDRRVSAVDRPGAHVQVFSDADNVFAQDPFQHPLGIGNMIREGTSPGIAVSGLCVCVCAHPRGSSPALLLLT